MTNRILNQALSLVRRKISVIPVGKNKKPLIPWTEFQKRIASEEEVIGWFTRSPDANLGVVTGEISNLFVLDADKKHNRTLSEFDLPKTVVVNTGGGGEHAYFRYPNFELRNSAGSLFGPGIDTRGNGGYVVAATSIHESGKSYEYAEGCSFEDVEPAEIPESLKAILLQEKVESTDTPKLYENDPATVVEGTRNETAASVAGKILSETPIELAKTLGWDRMKDWNSKMVKPLPEKELKAIWSSVIKYKNKSNQELLKKNTEKEVTPIYKTSFDTGDCIHEMVHDKKKGTTSFVCCDKDNKIRIYIEKINHGKMEYIPLPATHMLVSKGVVLFPSEVSEYGDEKELLGEIRAFIHRYVDISEEFEQIASYYVLLTWIYDKFHELPYLRAMGDYGSGKSRLIKTVGSLCYKPIFTGGATTPSPLFRIIDQTGGTLILDEADFAKSDMTSEIVKILNAGYQKGTPVLRAEGKGTFEVKAYEVFCPKIVATRETFSDRALESRFLVEEMGKSVLRADIPKDTRDEFEIEAIAIRNKLLKWRFDNYFKVMIKKDITIPGIHPRLNQIVLPLLSIINDREAEENLIKFIIKYNDDLVADRGLSRESDIVYAIFKLEHDNFNVSRFTVKDIADEVNELIGNGNNEEKIQPRKMGWYLRMKLQLKTVKTRKGFILNVNQNKQKLEFWKERYGITDAEIRGEHVNDVDVDDIVDESGKDTIPF